MTENSTLVSHKCAYIQCTEVLHLNAFGVDCNNYHYHYDDLVFKKPVVQPNITMDCNIGEIKGCLPLLNGLEPYCQAVTNVHDINYFSDFFDCIIANKTMQSIPGCSKCYCLRSRFDKYGVDCNRTKPLTPQ